MKYFFTLTLVFALLFLSSCQSDNYFVSGEIKPDLVIRDLDGFDFSLKEKSSNLYTGFIESVSGQILMSLDLDEEFTNAGDFSVILYKGRKIVKYINLVTGTVIYLHDIIQNDNCVKLLFSKKIGDDICVAEFFNGFALDYSFSGIVNNYSQSNFNSQKFCVPCFGIVVAAVAALACVAATVNANEDCVEAFSASCGDGGSSCCSMVFEASNCGGSCDITCN